MDDLVGSSMAWDGSIFSSAVVQKSMVPSQESNSFIAYKERHVIASIVFDDSLSDFGPFLLPDEITLCGVTHVAVSSVRSNRRRLQRFV